MAKPHLALVDPDDDAAIDDFLAALGAGKPAERGVAQDYIKGEHGYFQGARPKGMTGGLEATLSAGEAERRLMEAGYTGQLNAMDPGLREQTVVELERLAAKYPKVMSESYVRVSCEDLSGTEHANAYAVTYSTFGQSHIVYNAMYFGPGKEASTRAQLKKDLKAGWSLSSGARPNSVTTHEWGHVAAQVRQGESQMTDLQVTLGFKHVMDMPGVSRYAEVGGSAERFAENFEALESAFPPVPGTMPDVDLVAKYMDQLR